MQTASRRRCPATRRPTLPSRTPATRPARPTTVGRSRRRVGRGRHVGCQGRMSPGGEGRALALRSSAAPGGAGKLAAVTGPGSPTRRPPLPRCAARPQAGINAAGVALSSTETIESSEAALAADPLNNATGVRGWKSGRGDWDNGAAGPALARTGLQGSAGAPGPALQPLPRAPAAAACRARPPACAGVLPPPRSSAPHLAPGHRGRRRLCDLASPHARSRRPRPQITEDDVASIILPLPEATSARAAAAALGRAIEERGSGEGFGVLFSDRQEAWVSPAAGRVLLGAWLGAALGWARVRGLPCSVLVLIDTSRAAPPTWQYLENAAGHQWLVRCPQAAAGAAAGAARGGWGLRGGAPRMPLEHLVLLAPCAAPRSAPRRPSASRPTASSSPPTRAASRRVPRACWGARAQACGLQFVQAPEERRRGTPRRRPARARPHCSPPARSPPLPCRRWTSTTPPT